MHVGMLVDAAYSTCSVSIALCAAARDSTVRCRGHVPWWLLDFGWWDRKDKRDF